MKIAPIVPLLVVAFLIPTSIQADYSFTRIAVTTTSPVNFGPGPGINAGGEVVFAGQVGATSGLFVGNGGSLTTIVNTSSGPLQSVSGDPSINASGQVAFSGVNRATGATAIYRADGSGLTTIADTSGSIGTFLGDASINKSGQVAFTTLSKVGNIGIVFSGDGSSLTTIFSSGTNSQYQGGVSNFASINDSGHVAFGLFSLPTYTAGTYEGNGGTPTLLFDQNRHPETNGGFVQDDGFPTLNNQGQIASVGGTYLASGQFTGFGMIRYSQGSFTIVAKPDTSYNDFVIGPNAPAMNNLGEFAFASTLKDGRVGIFTGGDALTDYVIRVGDMLDGSTVTSLGISRFAIDDNGSVAFAATLANGRTEIFRADPTSVPEPTSFVLACAGLACGLGYAQLRRNPRGTRGS